MLPSQVRQSELPERERPSKVMVIYICPTPDCSNFYGSTDFQPGSGIEQRQRARNQNNGAEYETHSRVECPTCRISKGIHVDRVPHVVTEIALYEGFVKALKPRGDATQAIS